MGVPGNANPLLLVSAAAAAPTGYTITRSLRFNSADTAYLNRTPSSAGNRKTWTWSGWVKKNKAGSYQAIFTADASSGTSANGIWWADDDSFYFYFGGDSKSTPLFRDPSAWYHIVCSFDTTQSTDTERLKVWINNQQITQWASVTWPSINTDYGINNTVEHDIGRKFNGSNYSDFCLADVHFIDGQALGPSYFGEYDTNNVWQPKAFNSGGTTINDGTTWSSTSITTTTGISTNVGNDITDLFDGDVTTGPRAAGIGGTGIIQWSSGTIQGNVSVHTYTVGSPGDLVYFNGTTQLQVSPAANGWVNLGYVDLTELRFSYPSSGNVLFVDAIKVDGVIMIDNTTTTLSYGTNGFHLDFSDATSTTTIAEDSSGNNNDWTANNISVVQGNFNINNASIGTGFLSPNDQIENIFDGNVSTYLLQAGQDNYTVSFSPGVSVSSSIEIYGLTSNQQVSTNLSSAITYTAGQYTTVYSGSGTLTAINMIANGNRPALCAIKIDGELLLNSTLQTDSLFDSPTNANAASDTGAGGEVSGNYATWNPLATSTSLTLANGNLQINGAGGGGAYRANSTIAVSSGKWYWEATVTTAGNYSNLGIGQNNLTATDVGVDALSYAWQVETANKVNNSSSSSYGTAATTGDIVMFALDLDNNKFFVGKNGTWFASSDPATGANPMYSIAAGTYTVSARPYINSGSCQFDFNWGQRSWAYTAPTGYQPLTTALFDDPTIADGSTAMDVVTYSGNSGDGLSTTQDVTTGFAPGLVWIKDRTGNNSHHLFDIVRGAGKRIFSNSTSAESNVISTLSAFNSDGFTVNGNNAVNDVGSSYVSWTWDGGSSTVSNTDGSITSSVRANASAGFSIVTYTSSSSVSTVGHGLNVAPYLIITKNRSVSNTWWTYHESLGNTKALRLDTTDAAATMSSTWNNTSPTSSVFTVGGEWGNGNNIVAYCWAPVEGYSAFGRFYGNSSSDGVFQYCGFTPRWIMMKRDDGSVAADWRIIDTARSPYNVADAELNANLSDAESTVTIADIVSNGFKLRTSANGINGGNYISWAAFASHPFKYARAQ